MEDEFYRAYGTMCYARKLTSKEAMELLSEVRLGYMTGLITEPKPPLTIYQIMMNIQPGCLQLEAGRALSEKERDSFRAEYLRKVFALH
jgi:protein arginine kinase